MNNDLDPTNVYAFKFNLEITDKVDQVCAPLFHYLGVKHFGYARIFKNGGMLRIANNQAWTHKYFEKSYYNDIDLYSMRNVTENEDRLLLLTGEPQNEHCMMLYKEFQIWNALAIYRKFNEYCEFWFFGSSPNNTEVINFYMNKVDLLKKFTTYFKEKFAKELNNDDSRKLIVTTLKIENSFLYEKEKVTNFFNELNINSYQLGDQLFVTRRELECLFYLVQGKTMKEIARLMNISHRTIEFHLNNIKRKTNSYKKSQIINMFLENKVFCSLLP